MKSRRKRAIEFSPIKNRVVIWVGIVGLFISVVLIIFFWRFPNERELLTFTATVLSSTATVISAVYIAQGLNQTVEFSKLNRAIELTERWNSPDFSETKAVIEDLAEKLEHLSEENRLEAFNSAPNSEHDKKKIKAALVNICNFFEEIGVLTDKKLLDEEVLREFYQGLVISYYELFSFWIEQRRVKRSAIYSNFEKMYNRWNNESLYRNGGKCDQS